MVYILTMGYCSVLKRNELSSHEKTQRKLKCIFLSERGHSEKAACCMTPAVCHFGKVKTVETVKGSVVSKG